jgi:hypothetical protein
MTKPPTEVRRRLTLPDRIKAARQDEAAEKAPGGHDSEPEVAQATADTVTLPAATWERVRRLAELGEAVERGEFRPAAELAQAMQELDQLRQQMHQLAARQEPPRPNQAAHLFDDMLAYAAALRRTPARAAGPR